MADKDETERGEQPAEEAKRDGEPSAGETPEPELESEPVADQEPAAEQQTAPPVRAGTLALLLVLLTAVAGGVGGYYLWERQEALLQTQSEALQEFVTADALSPLNSRLQELTRETADLRARQRALAEDRSQAERSLVRLEETVSELRRQQGTLAERLGRLDTLMEAHRDDWLRGEAAYLGRVAQHRLRFHRDVEGALGALRQADALLAELGVAAIEPRQAIQRAVDRLVRAPAPDREALGERLQAVLTEVEDLPLARTVERAAPQVPEPEPVAGDWRDSLERAWQRLRETLGELVIVQRDREVAPLLSPEERYFLYQNLRLSLESAWLALAGGEQALYEHSLERAHAWLDDYFDGDDRRVQNALSEIEELAAVAISPALPELDAVLEPLITLD